jgi:hypothetical protein
MSQFPAGIQPLLAHNVALLAPRLLKYETFSAIAFCVVQILPALIQTAQKIHTRYRFVSHAKSEYFMASLKSKHFFFVLLSCPRQSGNKLIGCSI